MDGVTVVFLFYTETKKQWARNGWTGNGPRDVNKTVVYRATASRRTHERAKSGTVLVR